MSEQRTEPVLPAVEDGPSLVGVRRGSRGLLEELLAVRIVAWRAREMLDACPADSDSTAAYGRAVSAFEAAYDEWTSLVRGVHQGEPMVQTGTGNKL